MQSMDDLYEEVFGYKPRKQGTSYEIIVGCVLQHLNSETKVTHNVFNKSSFSEARFQVDNLVEGGAQTAFVEAKDHLRSSKKVGRPEIQTLAGALILLDDVDAGIVASSTDFTSCAEQYTSDLLERGAKPIDLIVIRPSTEEDSKDTIQTVHITMRITTPVWSDAQFEPIFAEDARDVFLRVGEKHSDEFEVSVVCFYDREGNVVETIANLTSQLSCNDHMVAEGRWDFNEGTMIKFKDVLLPIESLKYQVPYKTQEEILRIEMGKPVIAVKTPDGRINKIISTNMLREAHKKIYLL